MQGLILLNKPSEITSFGAVARIKRIAKEKRVGHTGTLDPMATGVLPIFLGRATCLSSYLLDGDKRYRATVKLGITTDSCDITGTILKENDVTLSNDEVLYALKKFEGEYEQTPPMFSAIKKDGVRLYELARKGIETEIPKRRVKIYSITQISPLNEDNEFIIDTCVSKGTYIRSLCRDIGEFLGVGATLTGLCRTEVSGFSINDCINLDCLDENNISEHLLNEEMAISHFKEIEVTENQARRFSNGGQLSFDRLKGEFLNDGEIFRIKCNGLFLGLGFADTQRQQIGIKCIINKYE